MNTWFHIKHVSFKVLIKVHITENTEKFNSIFNGLELNWMS